MDRVWEANKLITMEEYNEFDKRLMNYEVTMYEKCKRVIDTYREQFVAYGCEVELSLFWKYDKESKIYTTRPLLLPGYESGISCDITKDGKEIEVNEGCMSMSWMLYGWPKGRWRQRGLERYLKIRFPCTELDAEDDEIKDECEDTINECLNILKHINE